jgi:formylglycine-generating enzyme required for sulfatase activity
MKRLFDESVYGVRDLAGNMRDWTGTVYQADGDVWDGGRLVPGQGAGEAGSSRVARGGSWNDGGGGGARVANRYYNDPRGRYDALGFRLSRTI